MLIMIGAGSGHRKKAYLGVRVCPQCGEIESFLLSRTSAACVAVLCRCTPLGEAFLGHRLFTLQGWF